jgi:hypothetical protein
MRLLSAFLHVALTGCSASMVLKQPVVDQCSGAGLRGCDEITDGVLAYVDGDKAEGRRKLVSGAAQNNPEQVQQFARTLVALRDLPGMSDQMGPIGEVAAILSGDASMLASGEPATVASLGTGGGGETASGSSGRPKLYAQTTSLDDGSGKSCLDQRSASAICVAARRGGLVVTDVVFDGECSGAFVAALPWNVLATNSARWVLRKPVAGGTWPIEPDESLVIGGSDATKCDVTWAARAR